MTKYRLTKGGGLTFFRSGKPVFLMKGGEPQEVPQRVAEQHADKLEEVKASKSEEVKTPSKTE